MLKNVSLTEHRCSSSDRANHTNYTNNNNNNNNSNNNNSSNCKLLRGSKSDNYAYLRDPHASGAFAPAVRRASPHAPPLLHAAADAPAVIATNTMSTHLGQAAHRGVVHAAHNDSHLHITSLLQEQHPPGESRRPAKDARLRRILLSHELLSCRSPAALLATFPPTRDEPHTATHSVAAAAGAVAHFGVRRSIYDNAVLRRMAHRPAERYNRVTSDVHCVTPAYVSPTPFARSEGRASLQPSRALLRQRQQQQKQQQSDRYTSPEMDEGCSLGHSAQQPSLHAHARQSHHSCYSPYHNNDARPIQKKAAQPKPRKSRVAARARPRRQSKQPAMTSAIGFTRLLSLREVRWHDMASLAKLTHTLSHVPAFVLARNGSAASSSATVAAADDCAATRVQTKLRCSAARARRAGCDAQPHLSSGENGTKDNNTVYNNNSDHKRGGDDRGRGAPFAATRASAAAATRERQVWRCEHASDCVAGLLFDFDMADALQVTGLFAAELNDICEECSSGSRSARDTKPRCSNSVPTNAPRAGEENEDKNKQANNAQDSNSDDADAQRDSTVQSSLLRSSPSMKADSTAPVSPSDAGAVSALSTMLVRHRPPRRCTAVIAGTLSSGHTCAVRVLAITPAMIAQTVQDATQRSTHGTSVKRRDRCAHRLSAQRMQRALCHALRVSLLTDSSGETAAQANSPHAARTRRWLVRLQSHMTHLHDTDYTTQCTTCETSTADKPSTMKSHLPHQTGSAADSSETQTTSRPERDNSYDSSGSANKYRVRCNDDSNDHTFDVNSADGESCLPRSGGLPTLGIRIARVICATESPECFLIALAIPLVTHGSVLRATPHLFPSSHLPPAHAELRVREIVSAVLRQLGRLHRCLRRAHGALHVHNVFYAAHVDAAVAAVAASYGLGEGGACARASPTGDAVSSDGRSTGKASTGNDSDCVDVVLADDIFLCVEKCLQWVVRHADGDDLRKTSSNGTYRTHSTDSVIADAAGRDRHLTGVADIRTDDDTSSGSNGDSNGGDNVRENCAAGTAPRQAEGDDEEELHFFTEAVSASIPPPCCIAAVDRVTAPDTACHQSTSSSSMAFSNSSSNRSTVSHGPFRPYPNTHQPRARLSGAGDVWAVGTFALTLTDAADARATRADSTPSLTSLIARESLLYPTSSLASSSCSSLCLMHSSWAACVLYSNRPVLVSSAWRWSAAFELFVQRCVALHPQDRPTCTQLAEDEWFGLTLVTRVHRSRASLLDGSARLPHSTKSCVSLSAGRPSPTAVAACACDVPSHTLTVARAQTLPKQTQDGITQRKWQRCGLWSAALWTAMRASEMDDEPHVVVRWGKTHSRTAVSARRVVALRDVSVYTIHCSMHDLSRCTHDPCASATFESAPASNTLSQTTAPNTALPSGLCDTPFVTKYTPWADFVLLSDTRRAPTSSVQQCTRMQLAHNNSIKNSNNNNNNNNNNDFGINTTCSITSNKNSNDAVDRYADDGCTSDKSSVRVQWLYSVGVVASDAQSPSAHERTAGVSRAVPTVSYASAAALARAFDDTVVRHTVCIARSSRNAAATAHRHRCMGDSRDRSRVMADVSQTSCTTLRDSRETVVGVASTTRPPDLSHITSDTEQQAGRCAASGRAYWHRTQRTAREMACGVARATCEALRGMCCATTNTRARRARQPDEQRAGGRRRTIQKLLSACRRDERAVKSSDVSHRPASTCFPVDCAGEGGGGAAAHDGAPCCAVCNTTHRSAESSCHTVLTSTRSICSSSSSSSNARSSHSSSIVSLFNNNSSMADSDISIASTRSSTKDDRCSRGSSSSSCSASSHAEHSSPSSVPRGAVSLAAFASTVRRCERARCGTDYCGGGGVSTRAAPQTDSTQRGHLPDATCDLPQSGFWTARSPPYSSSSYSSTPSASPSVSDSLSVLSELSSSDWSSCTGAEWESARATHGTRTALLRSPSPSSHRGGARTDRQRQCPRGRQECHGRHNVRCTHQSDCNRRHKQRRLCAALMQSFWTLAQECPLAADLWITHFLYHSQALLDASKGVGDDLLTEARVLSNTHWTALMGSLSATAKTVDSASSTVDTSFADAMIRDTAAAIELSCADSAFFVSPMDSDKGRMSQGTTTTAHDSRFAPTVDLSASTATAADEMSWAAMARSMQTCGGAVENKRSDERATQDHCSNGAERRRVALRRLRMSDVSPSGMHRLVAAKWAVATMQLLQRRAMHTRANADHWES